MRRVLLLNPPAGRPVLRDYYCSTLPKAGYFWQPIDLLALGALLRERAEVRLIDACGERRSARRTEKDVRSFVPDTVFALVSTLTRDRDLVWLRRLAASGTRVVIGGEVALDPRFDFDAHPGIAGLVLDFTAPEAADFLLGEAPRGRVRTREHEPAAPATNGTFRLGPMPHDLLERGPYHLPLWGGFHSLLTDFGCPFTCSFCNSGCHSIGYKVRALDDVAADIDALAALGARRIYLRDMTFGARRAHGLAVLELLRARGFELRGFLRADLVDDELASALRAAGFTLGQIGIESPAQEARARIGKHLTDASIERAFGTLRRHGIAAGAHFVVGFDGEPDDVVASCTDMARRLDAAYCSINVYEPRHGSKPLDAASRSRRRTLSTRARRAMLRYNTGRAARHLWGFAARRVGELAPSRSSSPILRS
jgi:hypothetical protein